MIVPDSEAAGGERVKVLDFGLAKLADLEDPDAASLTRTGTLMGTPAYMAPEQCRSARAATDRSDVYALGCIMYEMLAGSPPFTANNDLDILAGHMYKQPPQLREEAPAVSADLAALIHRMLSKKPEERPSSAEVATQLSRLGGGLASSTGIPTGGLKSALAAREKQSAENNAASTLAPMSGPSSRAERGAGGRLKLLMGAGAIGVALLISGSVAVFKRATRTAAVVEKTTVSWQISSDPAGAEVLGPDGAVLGKTPLKLERPKGAGTFDMRLHLAGYADKGLALDPGTDQTVSEKLVAVPAAPETTRPATTAEDGSDDSQKTAKPGKAGKPGKPGKKDRKPKKGKGK